MSARRLDPKHVPLAATVLVFLALFATAALLYDGFLSTRVVVNLLADNAFLGITALGMTLVILSGGIDLSVGAVLAFTTIFTARLIQAGVHPLAAMMAALVVGAAFGCAMGVLIQRYELPPFLVTLAGMFLARGLAFVVSPESIGIHHPLYTRLSELGLPLPDGARLPATALIFLAVLAVVIVLARSTRFGRNLYALGGSESSARLMGLPVARTRVVVYGVNGLCSALAGVTATLYMGSGNPAMGMGLELDAIACVVIGGTLLVGGVGYPAGTLVGVLIYGTIQSALIFDGRLSSWWLRIAVGALLLLFIVIQRLLAARAGLGARAIGGQGP